MNVYLVEYRYFQPYEDWGSSSTIHLTEEDAMQQAMSLRENSVQRVEGWDHGTTVTVYRTTFGNHEHEELWTQTFYYMILRCEECYLAEGLCMCDEENDEAVAKGEKHVSF